MNNITAVLVDDEPKAIDNLKILLKGFCKNVKILGTATSVDKAIPIIEKVQPDVVFLDIEMPKKSGFELIYSTSVNFKTIFVTAYNEYAVKAFEVSAVDYLLKPVNVKRLQEAVCKIGNNTLINKESLQHLQENLESEQLTTITISYKDRYKLIKIEDILCFEADGAYSLLHCIEKNAVVTYTYSKSLRYFEKLLDANPSFFRSHRSWLINITKIIGYSKTTSTIELILNIEVPVSRNNVKKFQDIL